jgi:hypothetical protein
MSESTEIAAAQTTAIAIPSRSERAAALAKRVQATSQLIKPLANGVGFKIPGLGDTDGPIDVVILDFVAKNVYYDPSKPFDRDNITPPICGAIGFDVNDNLIPQADAPDLQAETCKECPLNQFGSRGKGKACQNRRVAAVLPPDADDNTDILMIDISATGLSGFDTMISQMATVGGKEPHNFVVKLVNKQAGNSTARTFGVTDMRPMDADRVAFFDSKIDAASTALAQPIKFD